MCVTFVFGKHKTKKCRLTRISIDVSHAFSPAAGRILWWRTWTPSETYPHSNTSIKPNLTNRYYSKSAIKTTTRRMTHERGVRWPFGYYKPPGPIRSYGPHHTHTHTYCVYCQNGNLGFPGEMCTKIDLEGRNAMAVPFWPQPRWRRRPLPTRQCTKLADIWPNCDVTHTYLI